jgi:hypothetical protein
MQKITPIEEKINSINADIEKIKSDISNVTGIKKEVLSTGKQSLFSTELDSDYVRAKYLMLLKRK